MSVPQKCDNAYELCLHTNQVEQKKIPIGIYLFIYFIH